MKLFINDVDLGEIDDELVKKISEKNDGQEISDIAIMFMCSIIGEEADNMTMDQIIKRAKFEKNNLGYDTIAEMLSVHMKSDLRPANEICKNCDNYHDQFCVYNLVRVDPFSKGNSCWEERIEADNITPIGVGYVKYGEELKYPLENTSSMSPETAEEDNVIQFNRPRWIIRDDEPDDMPSIEDFNKMMEEVLAQDPDELREELDREATEYDEGIELTEEERILIRENLERFINVSGHLYSIWLTARQHGLLSIRNVTEETSDATDPVIKYINDRAEDIMEGVFFENTPPDPLESTIDAILTAYSNYVLGGITGAVNPNRMKAVVKCFVDQDDYQSTMEQIINYIHRYDWLKET